MWATENIILRLHTSSMFFTRSKCAAEACNTTGGTWGSMYGFQCGVPKARGLCSRFSLESTWVWKWGLPVWPERLCKQRRQSDQPALDWTSPSRNHESASGSHPRSSVGDNQPNAACKMNIRWGWLRSWVLQGDTQENGQVTIPRKLCPFLTGFILQNKTCFGKPL